jgi:hypothetical protein
MVRIVPPTRQTPGFARRSKAMMQLQQRMRDNDPDAWDAVVAVLAPYVTDHAGYASAEDALWDASQDDLMAALQALTGNSTTP